jgi:predicted DNA-binding transcriptional regulator AlpA
MAENAPADAPPWAGVPASGPMLRPADGARYIAYSLSSYYRGVARGQLPKPIKMGQGGFNAASAIPQAWLDAVIADRASRS